MAYRHEDFQRLQLLKELQKDPMNELAWREFVGCFHNDIKRQAYRLCKKHDIQKVDAEFNEVLEDIVQNVYVRLFENERKAITIFRGHSISQFYRFLFTIVHHEVLRKIDKANTMKHGGKHPTSLDEPLTIAQEDCQLTYGHTIPHSNPAVSDRFREHCLIEDIIDALERKLNSRNKNRDILIFKLHLRELTSEQIASIFKLEESEEISSLSLGEIAALSKISKKRIENIILDCKKVLKSEGIEIIDWFRNG